jgi:hypothetical protein
MPCEVLEQFDIARTMDSTADWTRSQADFVSKLLESEVWRKGEGGEEG